MKLKCFHCHRKFENKEDIWRDMNRYPICHSCLLDELNMYDEAEQMMDWIEQSFHKSHYKMIQHTFEVDCPECGVGVLLEENDANSECHCWDCSCFFITENKQIIESYKNEDEYYAKTNQNPS